MATDQAIEPSPESILQMGTGFWASKVLLTAVDFDLFTLLAETGPLTAGELKQKLDLHCTDRHLFDFLDTLTGLGFLNRTGILETASYSNSPDTDLFLDMKKPAYVGGILKMLNNRLYGFWGTLEEGLRTGKPQNEAKQGENLFDAIYKSPEQLENFMNAMSGIQVGAFMAFAQKFDFSKYKTLTDAGGSSGLLSMTVANHQPHMSCTSVDLPGVTAIAEKKIANAGLNGRVKAVSGDFFKDPFPAADVVVMGNILHDWDEEQKISLMRSAYTALPKGGAFIAIENVIDDDRKTNVFGLLMSLNMLIETGTGFDYTLPDFNRWARQVGFSSTSLLPLAGPTSAAIAIK
ncbi:acetylserotonin O-methyltransferase [Dyadobacter sp. CY261]|uniref:acetylserotonin O-methyltransferase n=1 Tax=Dyadobacter sp. CY261 TaxID=2907203 RepID=UPI001F263AC3|nr:acetylserotonin O-methyltransferase [Dyadobacter sp. CY261]MCF0072948.1 acetylserotonin O-methyltransferase [Dyadobacter sp. CY261]